MRLLIGLAVITAAVYLAADSPAKTTDLTFKSHDGYTMSGKLTMPSTEGKHAVVIYVQTAEAMTVESLVLAGAEPPPETPTAFTCGVVAVAATLTVTVIAG